MNKLTVDMCPDADGHYTIREWDGTDCGDTNTCIATVYDFNDACSLAEAWNLWMGFDAKESQRL
jgi:hypothetical protein